jgi:hypothetical protein
MSRRSRSLFAFAAVATIALIAMLLHGDRGVAQSGGGVAPDLDHMVRKIADRKPTKFGATVKAKPGDLVQFLVLVRNYKTVAGSRLNLEIDRGPANELHASVATGGRVPQRVTVRSATGAQIALGTLRFSCVAPPTFCPVKFRAPSDRWQGSYEVPRIRDGAVFTATVVEPSKRP